MLIYFSSDAPPAQALANMLGMATAAIDVHRFPDGESLVTVPSPLPAEVVLFAGLHQPNTKLVELWLACRAARDLGVKRLVLIAPYLCYMRQDMAFAPGQAVSQRYIGEWLGSMADAVITVDPHLHRIERLEQAIPVAEARALTAAPLIGEFLGQQAKDVILVGPDEESRQWVSVVADQQGLDWVVATKQRFGDRDVQITLPEGQYQGRHAVLVDDVISSGHTLAKAADALYRMGCARVSAICTHALLAEDAETLLKEARIDPLWSTDSIPHASNSIPLAPLLAEAVVDILPALASSSE